MFCIAGCAAERSPVIHASVAPVRAYHLHLPGIGGYRRIDKGMLVGLQEGGLDADIEECDWTIGNPGLGALLGVQTHTVESAHVAKMITDAATAHPGKHADHHELSQRRGGHRGLGGWSSARTM